MTNENGFEILPHSKDQRSTDFWHEKRSDLLRTNHFAHHPLNENLLFICSKGFFRLKTNQTVPSRPSSLVKRPSLSPLLKLVSLLNMIQRLGFGTRLRILSKTYAASNSMQFPTEEVRPNPESLRSTPVGTVGQLHI